MIEDEDRPAVDVDDSYCEADFPSFSNSGDEELIPILNNSTNVKK
jgi:hypothetical protein